VSSPDELRSYAVDCARLAKSARDLRDKERLLNMARAWTDLADQLARIGQSKVPADLVPAPQPPSDRPECGKP